MKVWEIIVLLAVTGIVYALCFMIGAKVGQQVSKGEKVEMPTVNPLKAVRDHKKIVEAEHRQTQHETIMHNIDAYNGTSYGQKDVPRG